MNLENGYLIFIKSFKAYHDLTGEAAPGWLRVSQPLSPRELFQIIEKT